MSVICIWFLLCIPVLISVNIMRVMQARRTVVGAKWCFVMLFLPLITYITFIILAMFRFIVYIILLIRHRSKFNGFLKGVDAMHMTSKPRDRVINCLIMFKSEEALLPGILTNRIREAMVNMQYFSKFRSKFCKFWGYYYMVKDGFPVEACLREMSTVTEEKHKITKTELGILLDTDYFQSNLPRNNTIPWEVVVGRQAMDGETWGNEERGFDHYYPVLFRCEHALADGITLLQVMIDILVKEEGSSKRKIIEDVRKKEGCILRMFRQMDFFFLLPAFFIVNYASKAGDENVWGNRSLSGEKFYAFNRDHSEVYKRKARNIQRKYSNFFFIDIMLTLISGTINNYIKRLNSTHQKQFISATIPTLVDSSDLAEIDPRDLDNTDLKINNKYAPLIVNLPMHIDSENLHIEEEKFVHAFTNRIRAVNRERRDLRNMTEYSMWRYYTDIVGTYFPQNLLGYMTKLLRCEIVINIVPGPQTIHCWDYSAVISDIIAFTPNLKGSALTYTIVTYDERFYIGVSLDRSLMARNYDETHRALTHDIFACIDDVYRCFEIDPSLG